MSNMIFNKTKTVNKRIHNKRLQKTIEKMKQVLALMVKSEGYQEAVNLLYEIQKSQQDVLERTIQEQQERIKRILEGEKVEPPKP